MLAAVDVIPWTVDDRATMEALLDVGVHGLITDRPDLLREMMPNNGFRLPRAHRP